MRKLLTLTLSLLMAFSLCLTISADNDPIAEDEQGNKYYTLEEIISKSTGSPIKLIANYEVNSGEYLYTNVTNIDLDLNGYELNIGDKYIACNHNLTIRDNSDSKSGKIIFSNLSGSSSGAHISVSSPATFTLESGQIVNTSTNDHASTTIQVFGPFDNDRTNGQVIINGGTIDNSGSTDACIKATRTGAVVTINGGTLKSKGNVLAKDTYGGDATINLNKGTFSSDVSAYLASDSTIVKYGDDDYKVYGASDTVSIVEDTKVLAGLSGTARYILDYQGKINAITDGDGNPVTVDSSTQFVLNVEKLSSLDDDELDKVVELTGTEISKLSCLPLNITLTAINNGVSTTITDLGNSEMPVTLYLSDSAVSAFKGKTIKVVRFHGDEAVAIDAVLNGNVLTFNSGKFSTYVIAAYGSVEPTPSPTPTPTPSSTTEASSTNSDTKVVTCEEAMGSKNWTWSELKKACVYKVTNTKAN